MTIWHNMSLRKPTAADRTKSALRRCVVDNRLYDIFSKNGLRPLTSDWGVIASMAVVCISRVDAIVAQEATVYGDTISFEERQFIERCCHYPAAQLDVLRALEALENLSKETLGGAPAEDEVASVVVRYALFHLGGLTNG